MTSHSHPTHVDSEALSAASSSRPMSIPSSPVVPQDVSDLFSQKTPQGTPDVRSPRAQFGTPPLDLPPRNPNFVGSNTATPQGLLSSSPARAAALRVASGSATPLNPNLLDELTDSEKAKVLRRHLVSREERAYAGSQADDALSRPATPGTPTPGPQPCKDSDIFPLPYDVPGGDVTHDIYKWQSERRLRSTRSASFSGVQRDKHPAFEHIREPGGFRRNYLLLRAEGQDPSESENGSAEDGRPRMLKNFIDFLYIYGHFAGEDLEEDENDDEEEQDASVRANTLDSRPSGPFPIPSSLMNGSRQQATTERSPLLKRDRSASRRRRLSSASGGPYGDATVAQAVMMLLKSFIGTGVLFVGKAFYNGGILFSTITLVLVGLISLWTFLLLVRTKNVVSGSFGDIGGALYGSPMRFAILTSITISQIGFTCAYNIFVASNLQAVILAVSHCKRYVSILHLILAQLLVFLPLAMVRNLTKLSTAVLVADAFILVGLLYLFGEEFSVIAHHGIADMQLFNPKSYALLIGTAVFSFEGVGLVIPISDSMRQPHKFSKALTGVMFFLIFLFTGAGFLSYSAYGKDVQTVVLVNLPQDRPFVQIVQLLYAVAILLSIPLQLFPAVRIMENGLFTRSGKQDPRVKWEKNAFRFCIVVVSTLVSWLGASDLDKFVAFVGSFACVPLCYVYPPMLHYKACARTKWQKGTDIVFMVFGAIASVFTTVQTLKLMIEPNSGPPLKLGRCEIP